MKYKRVWLNNSISFEQKMYFECFFVYTRFFDSKINFECFLTYRILNSKLHFENCRVFNSKLHFEISLSYRILNSKFNFECFLTRQNSIIISSFENPKNMPPIHIVQKIFQYVLKLWCFILNAFQFLRVYKKDNNYII